MKDIKADPNKCKGILNIKDFNSLQIHIQYEHNSYQNSSTYVCKYIQDHYKIYMERQRTENSQNDPERKNKAGRLTPPNPKTHPTATAGRACALLVERQTRRSTQQNRGRGCRSRATKERLTDFLSLFLLRWNSCNIKRTILKWNEAVAFCTLTVLCNHHLRLVPKYLYHSKLKRRAH